MSEAVQWNTVTIDGNSGTPNLVTVRRVTVMPLSDLAIRKTKPSAKPVKLTDGGGLYLLLRPDGGRWWRLDYRRPVTGKRNTVSLGTYPEVGLADARGRRDDARKQLAAGIDPGEHRKAEKAVGRDQAANSFEVVSREWLAVRKPGWTDKNFDKEQGRLEKHAFPYIGGRPVASLGVSDIRPLIERLSKAGHLEQAHRLRFQLSRIFKFAVATERADRDPAADLSEVLPSRRDMVKQRYPTITDPERVGDLLRAIDGFSGTFPVACALKLAPMWFCRPGEIRMAEWTHFDLEGPSPTYRVPPANRKLRKKEKEHPDTPPHVIPLAKQAVVILLELQKFTGRDRYLFPGARDAKRHMSDGAINAALARIGFKEEMVGHGFRHMASTRLREMGWPREVVEAQLSHKVGGTEGVYNMAEYLPKRREMMQAWADYLENLKSNSNQ
ncbi:tyrosine-type recombinase/integrase [Thermomonas sp.]|uniref:tyrosine-type recombinase/integrase n=1 Tax=Thermomonas sp. TaxID=1971895 RepID=UPI0035B3BC0F